MNIQNGTTVIIDFERNGEQHQTIRWSSCIDTTERVIAELKDTYAKAGAEVMQITKLEISPIAIG